MLVIRLTRFGRKKKPFYRIVVADSSAPIKGKYIEKIGHYNPLLDTPEIFVDKEKTKKWLKVGAKPSDTVWNLLVEVGILKKKLITKRTKKKKGKSQKTETPEIKTEIKSEEQKEKTEIQIEDKSTEDKPEQTPEKSENVESKDKS